MNKIGWRIHGAAAASFGLITAAALFACGGDDTTSNVPDSGTDSSTDAKTDAPSTDGTTDGTTDAMADSTTDAPVVTEAGKDGGDGSVADADAAPTPLAPLNLCSTLDNDFANDIVGGTGPTFSGDPNAPPVTYDDRASTWGTELVVNKALPSFALALTDDCRINKIQNVFVDGGGPDGVPAYLQQLSSFVIQFMGCADVDSGAPGDAGALSFTQVIPAGAATHTFTQADLALIIELFVNSVDQQATIAWYNTTLYPLNFGMPLPAGFTVPQEPLTVEQVDDIRAHLQALAAAMPGVNPSTTKLTFSSCNDVVDAGDGGHADAGDAGHD